MAGAVGAMLILAILVTAYAGSVRTDLPRWGAEAERLWGDEVAAALIRLHERMAAGETTTLAASLPAPATPRALDVPVLGRATPIPASGSVAFTPACASVNVTHVKPGGGTVVDVSSGPTGCLDVQLDAAYTRSVRYRLEAGGLVRLDGPDAVVLAGPRVSLVSASPDLHRASLVLPHLNGPAGMLILSNGANLELSATVASAVIPSVANAQSVEVRLSTAYPAAWSAWWNRTIRDAGMETTASTACNPVGCGLGPGGTGTVIATLRGPLASGGDLSFAAAFVPTSVRIG